VIHVVGAVIRRENTVLLAKRQDTSVWEFPGGKVEAGESTEGCIRREIREELDIAIELDAIVDEFELQQTDAPILFTFYTAFLRSGTPRLSVHTAVEWVDTSALDTYPMHEADRRVSQSIKAWATVWRSERRN
jgi:mutator protein MutT